MSHPENDPQQGPLEVLPLLPLRGMLVFPHMVTPLEVGRERSVHAVEEAMLQDRRLFLVAQRQAKVNEPSPEDIYRVGTIAEVKQLLKMPEGQIRVLVEGTGRGRIVSYLQDEPYYRVQVVHLAEAEERTAEVEALMRTTLRQFEQYVKLSKKVPAEVLASIGGLDDPVRLADAVAAQLAVGVEEKQGVLEAASVRERLEQLCMILGREMEILELEKRIHTRVRKQMEKTQKEYYLREQMKAIQKELGERDERVAEVEELRRKIDEARLPKQARDKALHELGRLEKMPPMVAEAVVVRNYLDWLLSLPWAKKTRDRLDIRVAEKILEEDHYGLEKVKERILEFLAVRQLAQKMKGPILCLVGPPGVGKTSLARSVARALNRKFVRFSLGGVRDEAEIRGHRRTYVGAMPGKIIQVMRQAGTRNPVLLLDEVDKMSMDFRGDPSAALLEVLDPEQNHAFGDHYLEVTFDLSDVMFITTANVLLGIPRALRDRMEVISIAGYTEEEKLEIARRHLLPKQIQEHGLHTDQILVSANTIKGIIAGYTREAGVRHLERALAGICRKVAKEVVAGEKAPIRITRRTLEKYLGAPRYRRTQREVQDRVGLANGLAYTDVGGELLAIEVTVVKGKGKLTLTGKLGEVMRESAQASFSYIRSRAGQLGIEEDFHEKYDVHIHIPEGAIPKDGPSAGITIAVALASALSGRPVRADVAMTGEITLRGRVLPVGGIKEKVMAAHRVGVARIILPGENEKDLEEIPANIRRKLDFLFVEHMDQVIEATLRPAPVIEAGDGPEVAEVEEGQQIPFVPDVSGPHEPWAEV